MYVKIKENRIIIFPHKKNETENDNKKKLKKKHSRISLSLLQPNNSLLEQIVCQFRILCRQRQKIGLVLDFLLLLLISWIRLDIVLLLQPFQGLVRFHRRWSDLHFACTYVTHFYYFTRLTYCSTRR